MDKHKYLTPYRPVKRLDARPSCDFGRYFVKNNLCICMVYQTNVGFWTHTRTYRSFNTKEAAITSLDTILTNGGYILLTEEQMLLI
jgi:hypothetical protein